jgi:hypothetical protein
MPAKRPGTGNAAASSVAANENEGKKQKTGSLETKAESEIKDLMKSSQKSAGQGGIMSFFGKTPKRNEAMDESGRANDLALDSPSDEINKTRQVINLDDVELLPEDNDAPVKPAIDLPEGGKIVSSLTGKLKPHQVHLRVTCMRSSTLKVDRDSSHTLSTSTTWKATILGLPETWKS